MEITLQRTEVAADNSCTLGELLGLGFLCYTIERPLENWPNQVGPVAYPPGRYKLTRYQGKRFPFSTVLVNDVPGHTAIEIHPANWAFQLEGCTAPGLDSGTLRPDAAVVAKYHLSNAEATTDMPAVLESVAAFDQIMAIFNPVWERGEEIWLTAKNPPTGAAANAATSERKGDSQ